MLMDMEGANLEDMGVTGRDVEAVTNSDSRIVVVELLSALARAMPSGHFLQLTIPQGQI
jgi:hypothetical protein